MEIRVRPSSLVYYETTRWGRARGDATYAYRRTKGSVEAGWARWRAAAKFD
jgi:hypothetical protein